jgi:hypothetical protein
LVGDVASAIANRLHCTLFIYSNTKQTANLLNEKWTHATRARRLARINERDANQLRRAPRSRSEEFARDSALSRKPA